MPPRQKHKHKHDEYVESICAKNKITLCGHLICIGIHCALKKKIRQNDKIHVKIHVFRLNVFQKSTNKYFLRLPKF